MSRVAKRTDRDVMVMALDVTCAFLHSTVNRELFIELSSEDPASAPGVCVGQLQGAMCRTRGTGVRKVT